MLRLVVCVLVALLVPVGVGAANASSALAAVFAPRSDHPAVGAPVRVHDPTKPTAVVVLGAHGTVVADALAPYEVLASDRRVQPLHRRGDDGAGAADRRPSLVPDLDVRPARRAAGRRGPAAGGRARGARRRYAVRRTRDDLAAPRGRARIPAPVRLQRRRAARLGRAARRAARDRALGGPRRLRHRVPGHDLAAGTPVRRGRRGPRHHRGHPLGHRRHPAGGRADVGARRGSGRGRDRLVALDTRPGPVAPADHTRGRGHRRAAQRRVLLGCVDLRRGADPGVGELELASVFETYGGETLGTRTVALSADGGPVVSRHGLVFVPRGAVGASPSTGCSSPASTRPPDAPRCPAMWRPSTCTHGPASLSTACSPTWPATWTSRPRGCGQVDGSPDQLVLTGPSWPWAPLLRLVALVAGGRGPRVRDDPQARPPRSALTPVDRCRTVTG